MNTAFLGSRPACLPKIVPTEAGPAALKASLCFEAPYLIEKLVNDHLADSGGGTGEPQGSQALPVPEQGRPKQAMGDALVSHR